MTILNAKKEFYTFVKNEIVSLFNYTVDGEYKKKIDVFYSPDANKINTDKNIPALRVYFDLDIGDRAGLGSNLFRREGNAIISLFSPIEQTGVSLSEHYSKVDMIIEKMQKYYGQVIFREVYARDVGKYLEINYYQTNVRAGFFFDSN